MASPNRIGEIAGVAAAICILSFSFADAQRSLQKQLGPEYKKWLTEDVRWIIRDEERRDFWKLVTDDQRREFVDEFWARRNPSPKSQENPFKEEHYRRLAYANEHFAAAVAGRKTDRGRIYIVYGPPDTVRSIAGDGQKYPSEVWHYNHMKGGGDDVSLEFVDTCWCGEYPSQLSPPTENGTSSVGLFCPSKLPSHADVSPYRATVSKDLPAVPNFAIVELVTLCDNYGALV